LERIANVEKCLNKENEKVEELNGLLGEAIDARALLDC
jgi:hypothetical protein